MIIPYAVIRVAATVVAAAVTAEMVPVLGGAKEEAEMLAAAPATALLKETSVSERGRWLGRAGYVAGSEAHRGRTTC